MAQQNPLLPAPQDTASALPPASAAGLTGGDVQRIGRGNYRTLCKPCPGLL